MEVLLWLKVGSYTEIECYKKNDKAQSHYLHNKESSPLNDETT